MKTNFSRIAIACLLLCTGLPAMSQDIQQAPKSAWVQLFNGKDMRDWTVKIAGYPTGENYANTFRVQDGKLVVNYDRYDSFGVRYGHIFYKQPYSYYLIAAEYRFVGEQAKGGQGWATRNSGIMVHGQDPKTMTKDQDFPVSIEVQLLGGLGAGARSTANLCTPGTHVVYKGQLLTMHCINSASKTYDGDQWVRVEVLVLGDSVIKHIVNGDTVLQYTKPQIGGGNVIHADPTVKRDGQLLSGGYISLQSESHPIEFRKVELLNLEGCRDPKATNYMPHAVKDNRKLCRYPGKAKAPGQP